MTVGERMKKERIKKGLSGEEMARKMGICSSALRKWEHDEWPESFLAMLHFIRETGVTFEDLFCLKMIGGENERL